MKGLALETVVKMIILVVVALVVINLVIYFSNDIKNFLKNWFGKNQTVEMTIIKSETNEPIVFSTSQVMTYIRSCWDMTGPNFHEDAKCYILIGDLNGVDKTSLEDALSSPAQVDASKFDPYKSTAIISFEDVGNIVHIES